MFDSDSLDYHRARVRAELDLAMDAPDERAAGAHLRLSALHMRRVDDLNRSGGVAPPAIAAALLYAGRQDRETKTDAAEEGKHAGGLVVACLAAGLGDAE